jgi:hypothetical protein
MAVANPKNPGAWAPDEAPPTGDESSRFALGSNPSGLACDPSETVANVYATLAEARVAAAEPRKPETKDVALRFVSKRSDTGEWALFDRGTVSGPVTVEPVRPGRFARTKLEGGALLDELMLGHGAFTDTPDAVVWKALLELCKQVNPLHRAARAISDAVCRVVCLRAGLGDVPPWKLPNPGALIDNATERSSK